MSYLRDTFWAVIYVSPKIEIIQQSRITPKDAIHLLHKADCPPDVIAHARVVAEYVREIAERTTRGTGTHANIEPVIAGALLRDIGRARSTGIDHAVVGAEIVQAFCLDTRIVRIIRVESLTHIANSHFYMHLSTAQADCPDSTIALNKMTFYTVSQCK